MAEFDPDIPTPVLDRHADMIAGAISYAGHGLTVPEIIEATGLRERQVNRILLHRPCDRHSFRFTRERRSARGRPYEWRLVKPEPQTPLLSFLLLSRPEGVEQAAERHGILLEPGDAQAIAGIIKRTLASTIEAQRRRRPRRSR